MIFKLKINHFNKYIASKCTLINNDSSLPSSFEFYSQSRLSSLNITEDNILKIVKALNINKAHGQDQISVRLIKICDEALVKPCLYYVKIVLTQGSSQIYGKIKYCLSL